MTVYSTLAIADQLVASLCAWFDANRPTGFPLATALPCVSAAAGQESALPCLVVSVDGQELVPDMTNTGLFTVSFGLLTPWGEEADHATTDAAHATYAGLVATALAGITAKPGPLRFIYLHDHEDAGREHIPQPTHALTKFSRQMVASLGSESA